MRDDRDRTWAEVRAEGDRIGGSTPERRAAARQATEDQIRRGPATQDLEPARVVGRFPWQCPHCGHHRDDHTGAVPTEQGSGHGFGTCTGCPSCTGPDRR